MHLNYSPFDALGLDFGSYTKGTIQSAWRKAMRHSHPDKRKEGQQHWWPSVIHMLEARDFLLKGHNLEHYRFYPRLFSPDDEENKAIFKKGWTLGTSAWAADSNGGTSPTIFVILVTLKTESLCSSAVQSATWSCPRTNSRHTGKKFIIFAWFAKHPIMQICGNT
jgi:hypothetical protein